MDAQSLTRALGGRWHGSYGTARCPAHEDRRPSLSIRDGEEAPLVTCHAGCARDAVLAALRARGMWGEARSPQPILSKRRHDLEPMPADVEARARSILCDAKPADPSHPYLTAKSIQPHEVRQTGDRLVVPLIRDARLHGLQFIAPDGGKVYLRGSRPKGAYWNIGDPTLGSQIIIAEGFATGASIHEATGLPVIVAFSANNLRRVAEHWRRVRPDAEITVAGDIDDSGTGQRAAIEAARAVRGRVALPQIRGGA